MSKKAHIKAHIYRLIPLSPQKRTAIKHTAQFLAGFIGGGIILLLIAALALFSFEQKYKNQVFPGVYSGNNAVGGMAKEELQKLWEKQNEQFKDYTFTLTFEDKIATVTADQVGLGFDATTTAEQAFGVGRSGGPLSNLYYQYLAYTQGVHIPPLFRVQTGVFDEEVTVLAQQIDIPAQNALFDFDGGKVKAFKPAIPGRAVNKERISKEILQTISRIGNGETQNHTLVFKLPVEDVEPSVGNEEVNNLGIKELIGKGESLFAGSIPGRVHNVLLGASRINGTLIAPGETFSFNKALGDVTAATGYKQAYVIKNGRTVLDDGGGICQVSTTFFRAALNAGLPIVERHAHSYRVGYYEQGGWKPGFDATVFAPSYDLKIINDTGHHILIQATGDEANRHLTFEFYGTKDGRVSEVSAPRLWDARPPLPTIYQDDPTLPNGTMKQVDWSEPGLKSSFNYRVTRNGEELFKTSFYSDYVPWAAVYLKGTRV